MTPIAAFCPVPRLRTLIGSPVESLEPRRLLAAGLYRPGFLYPQGNVQTVGLTTSLGVGVSGGPQGAELAITSGAASRSGREPVATFATEYTVELAQASAGGGGVGVAFVVQTVGAGAKGTGDAGVTGLTPSVGVALVAPAAGNARLRLSVNGTDVREVEVTGLEPRGRPLTVRVEHDGRGIFVRLTETHTLTAATPASFSTRFDGVSVATTLGASTAFVGFTSSGEARLLGWEYNGTAPDLVSIGGTSAPYAQTGASAYSLTGSGGGFSSGGDTLALLSRPLTGDGTLTASVSGVAGLALRGSADTLAATAAVYVSGGRVVFASRPVAGGGLTLTAGPAVSAGTELRLVRNGPVAAGYVRQSGTWTLVGTAPLHVAGSALAGAVAFGGQAAEFSGVEVSDDAPVGADTGAAGLTAADDTAFWVDVMRQAGRFHRPGTNTPVATDPSGNPLADFSTRVMTTQAEALGTYRLVLTADQAPTVSLNYGTVSNARYDAASKTFRADLTFGRGGYIVDLTLRNTAGTAKNVRLLRPGYGEDTTATFTDAYLAFLNRLGLRALRTMNLTETNGNPQRAWSDRTPPDAARQTLTRPLRRLDGSAHGDRETGTAWEHVVALANASKTDLWINVPAQADDDYIRRLAELIKNGSTVNGKRYPGLSPDLNLYLEYSNEVWNPGFDAYHWAEQNAIREINSGGSTLNFDNLSITTDGTRSVWALRWYARRLAQIARTFESVFGAEALNTRVRPVLSNRPFKGQYEDMLRYVDRFVARPADVFYALGTIPYMNMNGPNNTPNTLNGGNLNPNLTADDVLATLSANADALVSQYADFKSVASAYGLRLVAYEAGTDTSGLQSQPAKAAAQRDPRYADLVRRYVADWFAQGGDLLMWFTAEVGPYGPKSGDFSLAERLSDLSGAKPGGFRSAVSATRNRPAPPRPTEVRASATSTALTVTFKHDRSRDTLAYEVDRSTTPDFSRNLITTRVPVSWTTSSHTVAVGDVAPGTTYHVRVRALSASGRSDHSSYFTVSTPGTAIAPSAPTGLTASAVSAAQLRLAFADVATNETGYRVELASDPAFASIARTFDAAADSTALLLSALDAGKTYYARVRATTAAAASPWSTAAPISLPAATPIAHYTFDDPATSPTAADSATNPAPAALANAPARIPGPSGLGTGLRLDGTTQSVDLGRPAKLLRGPGRNQITVSLWIKPDPAHTRPADLVSQDHDGTTTPYYLRLESPTSLVFGTLRTYWTGSPPVEARATLTSPITDGQWHHVSATYDGAALRLYLDGKSVAARDDAFGLSLGQQPVHAGRNARGGPFSGSRNYYKGDLDDLRFYDQALSPNDLAALAASSTTTPPPAPTAPARIIDSASSQITRTGRWWTTTPSTPAPIGGSYINDGNTNKGTSTLTLSLAPFLSARRKATLFIRHISLPNSAARVPVDITTAGGTTTLFIDQRTAGHTWISLGTHDLDPTNARITLRTSGTTGIVTLDAFGLT